MANTDNSMEKPKSGRSMLEINQELSNLRYKKYTDYAIPGTGRGVIIS